MDNREHHVDFEAATRSLGQKTVAARLPRPSRNHGTAEHSWFGKSVALIIGPRVTAKIQLKMEHDMLPLDYQAFNQSTTAAKSAN